MSVTRYQTYGLMHGRQVLCPDDRNRQRPPGKPLGREHRKRKIQQDVSVRATSLLQIPLYNGLGEGHEGEGLFEKIMPKNIPNLIREAKPQIQKAEGMRTG